ncbi:MAG: efflux RND transporter permease subunit [Prolixibacteraceae bacterium]|jgi:HAE1 family hydrophobic/amphiphilic exporter-1|nr:efflux RND transporter permease subunit [Prolixibacteraceae bacterium]
MKKLTEFSVNYPVTILMMVLAVLLLGYISYDKLGIDLFPEINNPRLFIDVKSGERPPEEMEKQFVENLEALAIRQSGVVQVSSVSKVGSAQITVEYTWEKDMDEAFLDLQKAATAFAQNRDIDEINISQHDPNTSPVMIVGLSHTTIDDMNELRKVADNYIRNELIRLEGVAEVDVSGAEENEVLIETEKYMLDAFGLTLDEVATRIQNFNQNISGGSINEMGLRYVVKGISLLDDIDDFGNVIVGYKPIIADDQTATKTPVFLREVAKISYQNKEPDNIVHLDGKRCLGLSIFKETKFNTVKAVEQVREALVDIEKALPGYQLVVITNQGTFINNAIKEVKDTALIGILLAVVVLFVFLRRIGTTLIVSIAMPISIIATFNLMYFNGLSLNVMTMGGLALGAGMLVDNAIVVMENIFRNHENGLSIKESAILGTSQVGGAITASTITTIVVFLPIVYLHGASGELFKDQAWTVAFSLLSSLVVAILVIPMLFNFFYKNRKKVTAQKSVQIKGYGNFLGRLLNVKWMVVVLALFLMAGGALLYPFIGAEFMPKSETREFSIELKMQEGTQLERTSSAVYNIENIISELLGDNLKNIYSHVGPSTGLTGSETDIFEGENTASIKVVLTENSTIGSTKVIQAIGVVLSGMPDIETNFVQDETALNSIMGTDEAPFVIEIKGEDLEVIEDISEQVKQRIAGNPELYNVKSSMEDGSPEVEVVVDRLRAGIFNLSVANVISQIQDQLEGKNAGTVEKGGEMQDITLKLPDKSLNDLSDIVIKNGAQEIRVNEIADIRIGQSPREIYHRNQVRIGKITAHINKDVALDKLVKKVEAQIADVELAPDYKISITGEEEKRKESMQSLSFALILSIALVYMVLASQFESLLHPFTVLLTIPLAVVGSVVLFFVLGKTFNIMALIGVIMLAGIAVNSSIILIDRINQLREEGLSRRDAIMQAGQQRIRPILMTSLTTILALLPLTLGFGESAALRAPMALAVIGGLTTSTLLSLVVIPCVYDVLDGLKDRYRKTEVF